METLNQIQINGDPELETPGVNAFFPEVPEAVFSNTNTLVNVAGFDAQLGNPDSQPEVINTASAEDITEAAAALGVVIVANESTPVDDNLVDPDLAGFVE